MKPWCVTLSTCMVVGLVGCHKESPTGGPGAVSHERTFTLSVPSGTTDIARGKRQEVTFKIDRGDKFHQKVRLEFKVPEGLRVIPPDSVIQPGKSEVKEFVAADENASLGSRTMEVTARPETGKEVMANMKVNVQ